MKIPETFARKVEGTFGDRGKAFLRALPGLVNEAAARWTLKGLRAADDLSYNYIMFARSDEMEVVLKVGVPDRELTSEIHAMRHFAGRGAARLLHSDPGRGMLLLERLLPGTPLASVAEDADATQIAAQLMLELLRPAPQDSELIQLSDWLQGFKRHRANHGGGTGPLDAALFKRAESLAQEILRGEFRPTLLHGDLHHHNILSSGARWAAIDAKGLVGPAAFEVGPLLLNPPDRIRSSADAGGLLQRRIAILAEILGIERSRIRQYGIAHAVLSATWSVEEKGDWGTAMECAKILAGLAD